MQPTTMQNACRPVFNSKKFVSLVVASISVFFCVPAIAQNTAVDPNLTDASQQVPTARPALQDVTGREPVILKAEAFAGQPYGVGKLTFRLNPGDQILDRTGAILIDDAQRRVLYPVVSNTPFQTFMQSILGQQENAPSDVHTVWFLFRGETPLTLSVTGGRNATVQVPVDFVRPRQFDRRVKQWWESFNRVVNEQIDSGDYPPMVQAYLKTLVGKRFGLIPKSTSPKKLDPLLQTFQLMFDVESLRLAAIEDLMSNGVQQQIPDQPLPRPIAWTPVQVKNMPDEIAVEAIARCVPEECFYLRFGTWENQIWLQRLMEDFGGNLSRMIQVRGFKHRIQSKFLDQMAIQSTEMDKLFGGRLIDDVSVIGMDTYFNSGSAVGVILHAKNSKSLNQNLTGKRKTFARKNKDIGVTIRDIKVNDDTIQFLSAPDSRYRSFYAVSGDCHLITTSLILAKRFLEAGRGVGSLADSDEFKFARTNMPLERDDTIFVYLSTRFFQNLLSPQYQIELRRRNRISTDMMLLELGKLAAGNEGFPDMSIDDMIRTGYLPTGFGYRPDGGEFNIKNDYWQDSIRGRRGFFAPIPDLPLGKVTLDEARWFEERAKFFTNSIKSLDPMVIAMKRFEFEKNVERVVFDARLAPFGEEKYGWLMKMFGPPLMRSVKQQPGDVVTFEASMKGGTMNASVPPHQIFAGVQDYVDPTIDLQPTTMLKTFKLLKEVPGYLGSWPSPGYTNWMPALGGQPDSGGYTYSRLLKLWKLQWESFSVLSFNQARLESLKPHLKIVEAERPAQVRIKVGDLTNSNLRDWANSVNYRRAWQTSIANTQLLNLLVQQFRVTPQEAQVIIDRMTDAELVCSLSGEYKIDQTPDGRDVWVSSKWPSFVNPKIPVDHEAPFLSWFRGVEVEVSKTDAQFAVHGFLDIQRQEAKSKLPGFDMFKGFGNMFGK